MQAGRNPRRAYTKDGVEIRPATVGEQRRDGATRVAVFCNVTSCCHHGEVSLDGWPDHVYLPDMTLRLRARNAASGT